MFGSCVIHILYTGCAKIKKKYGAKWLNTVLPRFPLYGASFEMILGDS